MNSIELKKALHSFLNKRKQLVLATYDQKHPWICTLYYVVDKDLNLYFLTGLQTLHAQQFASNPKVAVTIADSPQDPKSNKTAVQLWGEVIRVTDLELINWFVRNWTDEPHKYPAPDLAASGTRGVFKVTPKQLKLFDKELVGENAGYNFTIDNLLI